MSLRAQFGQRVRILRRRKKQSLEQLAAHCRLHPNFLQKLETGKQVPTLETVEKLAAGLGVPVAHLFHFDEQPSRSPAELRKELKQLIDGVADADLERLLRLLTVMMQ